MPRDRERKKKRTKSGGYRVDDLSKSDKGYHTYDSGDTDETYLPTGMLRFSYPKNAVSYILLEPVGSQDLIQLVSCCL